MNNVSCQYTGIQNFIFDTSEEAEEVLKVMKEICAEYDMVTVLDLKDLLGIDNLYRDSKYAWNQANMDVARVEKTKKGYVIDIPPAMYIGSKYFMKEND